MMKREKLSFIGSLMGMLAVAAVLGSAMVGCSTSPDNSRNPNSGTFQDQSGSQPYTR